jgi:polar amino acid transport system permease protein
VTDWTPSPRELERRRARRSIAVRRVVLATAATVVFFGVLGWVVTSSPGWPVFKDAFLNGDEAVKAWPSVIKGFGKNVLMFLVAEPLILVLAALVAMVRTTTTPALFPLRVVAVVYTDVFRGIPSILLVFLLAFGVPALGLTGLPTSLFWLALIALVLSYGAYVAEVFRAGIDSVHPSQRASALALGLSETQTMRHVVLPQAVRRVVPPLLNDFVSLQKDTALAGAVGVFEGLFAARDYANFNFNFTPYVVTALLFVALTVPLARFTDWLGRRGARRMTQGAVR